MMISNRVRIILLLVLVFTFAVLIGGGYLIDREKPPIPARVLAENGRVLFSDSDLMAGQRYYFSSSSFAGREPLHVSIVLPHAELDDARNNASAPND